MMLIKRGSYEFKAVGDIRGRTMMLEEAGPDQFIIHTEGPDRYDEVSIELSRDTMREWVRILNRALDDSANDYEPPQKIRKLIIVSNRRDAAYEDLRAAGIEASIHDRRFVFVTEEYDIHRTEGLARETPWVWNWAPPRRAGSIAAVLRARFGEPKTLDWVKANW